jgi:hypothetical protein
MPEHQILAFFHSLIAIFAQIFNIHRFVAGIAYIPEMNLDPEVFCI